MLTEKIAEGLARRIDRRKFLARAGAGAAGGLLAATGLSKAASSSSVTPDSSELCCNLCNPPSTSCYSNRASCGSIWCWNCNDCAAGGTFNCCECYSYKGGTGECPAKCSYVYQVSYQCKGPQTASA